MGLWIYEIQYAIMDSPHVRTVSVTHGMRRTKSSDTGFLQRSAKIFGWAARPPSQTRRVPKGCFKYLTPVKPPRAAVHQHTSGVLVGCEGSAIVRILPCVGRTSRWCLDFSEFIFLPRSRPKLLGFPRLRLREWPRFWETFGKEWLQNHSEILK
jgi:hypothetical protein